MAEQTELDLGNREPGTHLEFLFRIKNAGTAPLRITKVKANCGCIATGFDAQVPAGGTGTVSGTFATENGHGPVVKYLTVFSNDLQRPELLLTMKVTLQRLIETEPGDEVLFVLLPGKGEERIVTVHSHEPQPLKILKVETSVPNVKAEIMPRGSAPDAGSDDPSRQQLRVRVLPAPQPTWFNATLTVHTNSMRRPRLVLKVSGHPQSAIVAYPPRLYLDELPARPEAPIARPITLMKPEGSFQVLSAETRGPALSLQVMPAPTGQFCEVVARYTGGWKPGRVQGVIVLTTSDPSRPRIEIPYRAQVVE